MVHNYTVYNMKNSEVVCYLWDETGADLSSNVFASLLVHFLETEVTLEEGEEVIIYSDGCAYQNRNCVLANALSHLAVQKKVIITQKILERGHTQMECDSVHSSIEGRLKHQSVFLPSGYINIIGTARTEIPYRVVYLEHTFFKQYSKLNYYSSIRPGKVAGDSTVSDIRALQYRPDGDIFFKLRHPNEWAKLPQRRRSTSKMIQLPPPLFESKLPITREKYNHLQSLKHVLPRDTHSFYDSLPHKNV